MNEALEKLRKAWGDFTMALAIRILNGRPTASELQLLKHNAQWVERATGVIAMERLARHEKLELTYESLKKRYAKLKQSTKPKRGK